jgi:hypothetical protein
MDNSDDKPQRTILLTTDYGAQGNNFSGEVNWMEIDLDKAAADADHIIKPEERLALAMAIQ